MIAVLLSVLVFPGVGHIYLKRYIVGAILSVGSAGAIYYIVSVIVTTAREIAEKIQNGSVTLDVATITDLVSQKLSGSEHSTNVAMFLLIAFWVIGVVDSFRQGRAQEKVEAGNSKNKT